MALDATAVATERILNRTDFQFLYMHDCWNGCIHRVTVVVPADPFRPWNFPNYTRLAEEFEKNKKYLVRWPVTKAFLRKIEKGPFCV